MVVIIICFKFKTNNKKKNFPTRFCLGGIFKKFGCVELEVISFKGRNI